MRFAEAAARNPLLVLAKAMQSGLRAAFGAVATMAAARAAAAVWRLATGEEPPERG